MGTRLFDGLEESFCFGCGYSIVQMTEACHDYWFDSGIMYAECKDQNGQDFPVRVNLMLNIGNSNGVLKWGGTKFYDRCRDCELSATPELYCSCYSINGAEWKSASLNLSDHYCVEGGLTEISTTSKLIFCGMPWRNLALWDQPDGLVKDHVVGSDEVFWYPPENRAA